MSQWTKLEHDVFLKAISLYGTNDWNQISSFVVTKNPKQCYSYGYNSFQSPPNFNWTIEEYDMFISKAPVSWILSSKWKKDEVRMKLLSQHQRRYELLSSKQNSNSDSDKNNAKRQKIALASAPASAPAATPAPDSGGAIVPITSPTTDTATNATTTTTTTTTTTESILLPELLKRFFSQQLMNQAMKYVQELNAMDQQLAVDDELHSIVQEVSMAVDSVTKSIVSKFHKQKQYNESGNGNGRGTGSSVSNSNSNSDSNSDFIVSSSSSSDNDDGCYRGDSGSGGGRSGRDFVEDENEGFDEIDNDNDDDDDCGHSADEGDDVLVF